METNKTTIQTSQHGALIERKKNYIAVNGAKGVVAFGIENKIRDVQTHPKFKDNLYEVIKTIWEIYCGADPTMLTDEFLHEASQNIIKKFGMLGVNEIKEAFRLASNNVISSDLRSFGGRISVQVIGKTLDSYLEYRKPIAAEIMKEQNEQNRIQKEIDDSQSRNDYQKIVFEFWESGQPKQWQDCPYYFLETLLELGIVELEQHKKHEFYKSAKEYRIGELERKKSNSVTIEDIRNANRQLWNIEGEKAIITNYAKSMYLFDLLTNLKS